MVEATELPIGGWLATIHQSMREERREVLDEGTLDNFPITIIRASSAID